ncbi:hypothetical protein [Nocardia sp. NPDC047038]|uniref:hypothetical protein n=1 Tax=Nocardia sp. NPDC047038 TaxID=3154338 RepID=UPI0033CB2993
MNPTAEVTSITAASGAPRRGSSTSTRRHDDPWAEEYGRDIWDLRRLGARRQPSHQAYLRFDVIPQPWLKSWRSAGLGGGYRPEKPQQQQYWEPTP